MRFPDLVSMALLAIRQQKTRTALSLVGIVIGSLLLLFGLAARRGVQNAVARVFSMSEKMRQISVRTNWEVNEQQIPPEELEVDGDLDEAMRSRIRAMLVRQWPHDLIYLTGERIEIIEALPHVNRVHPDPYLDVFLIEGEHELRGRGTSVASGDDVLRERVFAGQAFESDSDQCILLNEFVAWRWGCRSASEMGELVGKQVRIESRDAAESVARSIAFRSGGNIAFTQEEIAALNSALDRLPASIEALSLSEQERAAFKKAFSSSSANHDSEAAASERVISQELTIAGIFRGPTEEEMKNDVRLGHAYGMHEFLLPIKTANQFALSLPHHKHNGFSHATVLIDDESHLRTVSEQIRELGLTADSLVTFVEFIQQQVRQVTLIVSLIAVFALVISAVGIANTMVMSVVERTREIGVMKALGAREGQIQLLFLTEGALIGVIGGAAALVIGQVIRLPIESLTISFLESQWNRTFPQEPMIAFPLWLQALVLAFSTLVTTLATILPARRAARIDPVSALRHD